MFKKLESIIIYPTQRAKALHAKFSHIQIYYQTWRRKNHSPWNIHPKNNLPSKFFQHRLSSENKMVIANDITYESIGPLEHIFLNFKIADNGNIRSIIRFTGSNVFQIITLVHFCWHSKKDRIPNWPEQCLTYRHLQKRSDRQADGQLFTHLKRDESTTWTLLIQ